MSRFFTPVEFPELKKVEEKKVSQTDKFPADPTSFIVEFNRLLSAIESGQSGIVKNSVDLRGSPVRKALATFEKEPNGLSLKNFLKMLEQDVSRRAKQEAVKILRNGNKEMEKYLSGIGV